MFETKTQIIDEPWRGDDLHWWDGQSARYLEKAPVGTTAAATVAAICKTEESADSDWLLEGVVIYPCGAISLSFIGLQNESEGKTVTVIDDRHRFYHHKVVSVSCEPDNPFDLLCVDLVSPDDDV